MSFVLRDRVKETTTDSGLLDTVTLGGAVTDFQRFYEVGVLDIGDTVPYLIQHTVSSHTNQWQVGTGTLTSATELTLTTIDDSSNGGAQVNFSVGIKHVLLSINAAQLREALRALVAADIPDLDASIITTGTFDVARIPDLDASIITTGAFDPSQIPDLHASVITTGTFDIGRIPPLDYLTAVSFADITGTATASQIPGLDASKIITGIFDEALIPALPYLTTVDFSDLTGTASTGQIPGLAASKITSGTFSNSLINWASPSAIGTGTPAAGTFAALTGTTGTFSGNLVVDTNVLAVNTSTDRVGIGTASPAALLDVNGEAYFARKPDDSTKGYLWVYNDGNLQLKAAGGATSLNITSTYIGLTASGNISLNGTIIPGGDIAFNGTTYATAGTPLTISNAVSFTTWGWDGSVGYNIASSSAIRAYQVDTTPGHAALQFRPGNVTAMTLLWDGKMGLGTVSPTTLLDINGDTMRQRIARTITNSNDTGAVGEHCWDSNFEYRCVATDTWKRAALSSW